jgi:hypothetical protein
VVRLGAYFMVDKLLVRPKLMRFLSTCWGSTKKRSNQLLTQFSQALQNSIDENYSEMQQGLPDGMFAYKKVQFGKILKN